MFLGKLIRFLRSDVFKSLFVMGIRGGSLVLKFALTLFVARYMSFEDLGFYGLVTAASIMAPIFIGLQLVYMITRKAVTQHPEEIVDSLFYYWSYLGLLYSLFLLAAIVGGLYLGKVVLCLLVLGVIFLEHLNNDIYQLLLNRSMMVSANLLHFVRSGLWIFVFILWAFFEPSLRVITTLFGFWCVGGLIALAGFFFVTRHWGWSFHKRDVPLWRWVFQEFKHSKVIYFNSLLNTSSHYVDRYLLTFFLGLEMTGVYVFFWSVYSALSNLLRTGVIQVARPKMVKAFKFGQLDEFAAIYYGSMKRTFVMACVFALAAGGALYLIVPHIDKPLAVAWFGVLWVLMVGFVLTMVSEIMGLVFYSRHRDDLTFKTSFACLFSSALCNAVLIPFMGLWGAGLSLILSYLAGMGVQYYYVRRMI